MVTPNRRLSSKLLARPTGCVVNQLGRHRGGVGLREITQVFSETHRKCVKEVRGTEQDTCVYTCRALRITIVSRTHRKCGTHTCMGREIKETYKIT